MFSKCAADTNRKDWLYPLASYKLAPIYRTRNLRRIREPQCLPLPMGFTRPFLSLVSFCAPSPSTGTYKVRGSISRDWCSGSKSVRRSLEYGHLLVYDLGRSWMPFAMHQLNRMEQKHN